MDTLETLKELLNEMDIDMDVDEITEDTELFDEIGLKPSTFSYLIASAEDAFGVDFSDTDFSQVNTVGELTELIEEQM